MAIESVTSTMSSYREPVKSKPEVKVEHAVESSAANTAIAREIRVVTANEGAENMSENAQQEQAQNPVMQQRIKSAVKHANTNLKYTRCEFSYHEETKRVSIRVLDKDSGEVIREIPPEESLDLVEKIWELAGIVVDEKR